MKVELPEETYKVMRDIYEEKDQGAEWKNFRKCQRNPFFKGMKLVEQNYICPACGKTLKSEKKIVGHHLSYDRACITSDTYRAENGRNLPDCEKCYEQHKDEFDICQKNIMYAHAGCHYVAHGIWRK